MSKIIEGAKEALAFARGEGSAAKIYAAIGGAYVKDENRPLTQVALPGGGFIVWNWDAARWDHVEDRVQVMRNATSAVEDNLTGVSAN